MTSCLDSCARCQAYSITTPALIDACAEQAETCGLTIERILELFLAKFHGNGHRVASTQ